MLDTFIQAQVKSMKREGSPGVPDARECLEIVRVAKTSVAAYAGLQAGDLLQNVGGRAAAGLGARFLSMPASERRYQFYSPATGERVRMDATGIDLGVSLRPTSAAIVAGAALRTPEPSALLTLWEGGKWASLQKLCAAQVDEKAGLLARFRKSPGRETPALLLLGAALYELGKKKDGLACIREYDRKVARLYPTSFLAVSSYYNAREAFAAGRTQEAQDALHKALELDPSSERLADSLEEMTGTRPEKPARWRGRVITLDYALEPVDGGGKAARLSATLAEVPPEKLFLVCFLGTQRGSVGYNDFMYRFVGYMTNFQDYVHGLHVVTKDPKRKAETPEHYKGEEAARLKNLPFSVLYDKDGRATDAVGPLGSPWVFAIDRRRKVFGEGEMEGIDFWNAIAAAEREPRE